MKTAFFTAAVLAFLTAPVLAEMGSAEPGEEFDSGGPVGTNPIVGTDVAAADGYDAPVSMPLSFVFMIDDGLMEQDVFYEKVPGSGAVFRPTAATKDMDAPLFAAAEVVPRALLDTDRTGPFPKGKPLGLTLGEYFAATGEGTYTCENGTGHIDIRFENLVPDTLYTMWHDFMVWPPTEPFIGSYDLPFGARDGSDAWFRTEADGSARFVRSMQPCLQLSGEHLLSDLTIAWHSDGKTHGPKPGEFSTETHMHIWVALPPRAGI